jgi:nitrate reductase (cytochrome), electron transfer subunit
MKKSIILGLVMALAAVVYVTPVAAEEAAPSKGLRGNLPLDQEQEASQLKPWQRDRDPIPRDYVQQPPLIPHSIASYQITRNANKCLDCHSWSRYKEFGATKISLTHFKDRAGTELADVSARRYFCTTCHVPQVDAKPLVENTFKPINAMTQH